MCLTLTSHSFDRGSIHSLKFRLEPVGLHTVLNWKHISNAIATDFSTPFQTEYLQLLMKASEGNWQVLRQTIGCSTPSSLTEVSLDLWDALYSMEDRITG